MDKYQKKKDGIFMPSFFHYAISNFFRNNRNRYTQNNMSFR